MVTSTEEAPSSRPPGTGRLRICLAASGGGHVRQLLDLEPVWSAHDYFFVTEDTALGRSLASDHRCYFIPHVAIGQARLGSPLRMLAGAVKSFFRSAGIILKERPQVILTTGAGAVWFALIWARLTGARCVVIESFARFDRPSLFAKLAAPLAHVMVLQSKALAPFYPKAKVFDPLKYLDTPRPPKQPLLFATVGATLPFDRMVKSVADLVDRGEITEKVIVQTGIGGFAPEGIETLETLPFDRIQALLKDADIVVCHGGTGSLITALRQGCRVVAMPRLPELNEHYDNHQAEITEAFAARGLIGVAKSTEELSAALKAVRERPPRLATTDPAELIAYLNDLLAEWSRPARGG